jgi:hypothetical protein
MSGERGRTSWSDKSFPAALNAARSRSNGEGATVLRRALRFFLMFNAQVATSRRCLLVPLSLVALQPVCIRAESFWEAAFTARMRVLESSRGGESGVALCFSFGLEIASLVESWRAKSSTSSPFLVDLITRLPAGLFEVAALGGI